MPTLQTLQTVGLGVTEAGVKADDGPLAAGSTRGLGAGPGGSEGQACLVRSSGLEAWVGGGWPLRHGLSPPPPSCPAPSVLGAHPELLVSIALLPVGFECPVMGAGPKSSIPWPAGGRVARLGTTPEQSNPQTSRNWLLWGGARSTGSWKGALGGSLPDVEDSGCVPVSSPLCPGRVLVTRLWPALLYGPACGERCWEAGALPHTGLVLWGPGPGWSW